jgi:hypothetical protein
MSAANPNPMEKSMVSMLVVANTGGGSPLPCGVCAWAEVVKSSGINVQIVLGNGNVGLTTLTKMRGERRGAAAQRLTKRKEDGERGAKRRGNEGPEVIPSRGNKGGQMGKQGRGREEERGEPSVAAPMQAGHLDQMTRG